MTLYDAFTAIRAKGGFISRVNYGKYAGGFEILFRVLDVPAKLCNHMVDIGTGFCYKLCRNENDLIDFAQLIGK